MKRLLSLLGILLIVVPHSVLAGSADTCRERTNDEIARELRLYRAYLFGKPKAEKAPLDTVRYDRDGWAWIKADDSDTPWKNSHPSQQGLTWSNDLMDAQDEHADVLPIKGIFATKRVMTSELIPYALQSIRAMECRVSALCEVARYSEIQTGDDPVPVGTVQPAGCIAYTGLKTWPECHFGNPKESFIEQVDSQTYCNEMSLQLLQRETELLKLAFEYDAGYRTLLQFAGNFDILLQELRWPLSGTMLQAVSLIGQMSRIPCFLSSCDIAPPVK